MFDPADAARLLLHRPAPCLRPGEAKLHFLLLFRLLLPPALTPCAGQSWATFSLRPRGFTYNQITKLGLRLTQISANKTPLELFMWLKFHMITFMIISEQLSCT